MIPAAPASSNAVMMVRRSYPLFLMFSYQALVWTSLSCFMFSKDSGVAHSFQLSSGRPVGCFMAIITNFPFTWGSHFWKDKESLIVGRTIHSAVTPFLFVPGLHANWVPFKVCTLG